VTYAIRKWARSREKGGIERPQNAHSLGSFRQKHRKVKWHVLGRSGVISDAGKYIIVYVIRGRGRNCKISAYFLIFMWRQTESLCIATANGTIVLFLVGHRTWSAGYVIIPRETKLLGRKPVSGPICRNRLP